MNVEKLNEFRIISDKLGDWSIQKFCIIDDKKDQSIKLKGVPKDTLENVTWEMFINRYKGIPIELSVNRNFHRNLNAQTIEVVEGIKYHLAESNTSKHYKIKDSLNRWVSTKSMSINYDSVNKSNKAFLMELINDETKLPFILSLDFHTYKLPINTLKTISANKCKCYVRGFVKIREGLISCAYDTPNNVIEWLGECEERYKEDMNEISLIFKLVNNHDKIEFIQATLEFCLAVVERSDLNKQETRYFMVNLIEILKNESLDDILLSIGKYFKTMYSFMESIYRDILSQLNVNVAGARWSTLSWMIKLLIIDNTFYANDIIDKSLIVNDDSGMDSPSPIPDDERSHPKYHLYMKAWKDLTDIRINSPEDKKGINAKNTLANAHAKKYQFTRLHRTHPNGFIPEIRKDQPRKIKTRLR